MAWIEALLNAQGKGRQRSRQRVEHRNGHPQSIWRTHERCVPATVRGNGGAYSISAAINCLRVDRDPQQTALPIEEVLGIELPSEINCDFRAPGGCNRDAPHRAPRIAREEEHIANIPPKNLRVLAVNNLHLTMATEQRSQFFFAERYRRSWAINAQRCHRRPCARHSADCRSARDVQGEMCGCGYLV